MKWIVTNEEFAPNGSEMILTGRLEFDEKRVKDNPRNIEAIVRVSKETDAGRWRITFIQIKSSNEFEKK